MIRIKVGQRYFIRRYEGYSPQESVARRHRLFEYEGKERGYADTIFYMFRSVDGGYRETFTQHQLRDCIVTPEIPEPTPETKPEVREARAAIRWKGICPECGRNAWHRLIDTQAGICRCELCGKYSYETEIKKVSKPTNVSMDELFEELQDAEGGYDE